MLGNDFIQHGGRLNALIVDDIDRAKDASLRSLDSSDKCGKVRVVKR